MKSINIIRAWKDQAYRNTLSEAERAGLPENPAGVTVLPAQSAAQIKGGASAVAKPAALSTITVTCVPQWTTPCRLCRPR